MEQLEQYDLFGEAYPVKENKAKPGRKRFKTMQELYGDNPNHQCKECKHLIKLQYSKHYYKCSIWRVSHSTATDIRVRQTACNMFEKRSGNVKSYMGG